jgi:hypothetical protein
MPKHEISTEIFQTFVSGVMPDTKSKAITDLTGKNISEKQKFCEMRHQYYIWQNSAAQYDYVGFEHYRRLFYIDPLSEWDIRSKYPKVELIRKKIASDRWNYTIDVDNSELFQQIFQMRVGFNEENLFSIKSWIKKFDLIYTLPIFEPLEENISVYHANALHLWNKMMDRVAQTSRYRTLRHFFDAPPQWSGYLNMYLMRSELFIEYMDSIFPLLLDMEEENPDAPSRIWGHFSERMLGAFIVKKTIENPLFRCKATPNITFARQACE